MNKDFGIILNKDVDIFANMLSLGETYMSGSWDSDDLEETMFQLYHTRTYPKIVKDKSFDTEKAIRVNLQSEERSTQVIDTHYDLGNDLFEAMLGPTMSYTCAYWKNANNLDDAQHNKFDLVARKLELRPGKTVLDLGCGFGAFALFAARFYQCKVVGYTLSEKQAQYARELCKDFDVEIIVDDYRKAKGKYDAVVSMGLMEHIGFKNYRSYMKTVYRCLKDDGVSLLHTIGLNASQIISTPWIEKYIFPNGMIPSMKQLGESMENLFVFEDLQNLGVDYNKTITAWFNNFDKNYHTLKDKYDETFYRMWKFYLLSSSAGFKNRDYQLWQILMTKKRLVPAIRVNM